MTDNTQETGEEYLIVGLSESLYGVDAQRVQEVIRMPEITVLEDAPLFVMGVINLRGRVVPVLDLGSRLGRPLREQYLLTDSVVVLEQKGELLGLLVNEVREIVTLSQHDWDATPRFEAMEGGESELQQRRYRFVRGVARVGDELVMLLTVDHLLHIHPAEWLPEGGGEREGESELTPPLRHRLLAEGGESAQTIFRTRAQRLRQRLEQQELEEQISLAIIRLQGEMLAVELKGVAGFAKVNKITPVPCCPPHIVGSMNLRGEVLILVDLCQVLDIPVSDIGQSMEKAVVVTLGSHEVGVMVHDVVDVIHVRSGELAATPVATSAFRGEHLQGSVPYNKQMLGILNIQAMLADPALLVNEEV
ncbi:MAG: chemotaxis protein CheW [Magnetococcales bacterium]|nr:chemotaxis protein CheW [Magnetococcales bacterium]